MRVLVCGDRLWKDELLIPAILTGLYTEHMVGFGVTHLTPFTLIEGCARGADMQAHWWGEHSPLHQTKDDDTGFGVPSFQHLHFPADWQRFGKAAGPIRNQQMLEDGQPELVLAFHDDPSRSKGTKNMLRLASRRGVPAHIITSMNAVRTG